MSERTFHIVSRNGVEATVTAKTYIGACLKVVRAMGLGPEVIEGTYRILLPGGTRLYAVEVEL